LVYLLHDVRPKSSLVVDILAKSDQVYTSLRTIEEASYVLVRIYATKHYGARSIYQIREIINRYGLEFIKGELDTLRNLLSEFNIVVLQDKAEVDEIHDTMVRYNLLPGDSIIALTCKHYNIDTILTFDEDFKRVPWLKVIP
jgi:hypothetical protein